MNAKTWLTSLVFLLIINLATAQAQEKPLLYVAAPTVPGGITVDSIHLEQVLLGMYDVLSNDSRVTVEYSGTRVIDGLDQAMAGGAMAEAIALLQANNVRYLAWARFVNNKNGIVTIQAWILDTITNRIIASAARTAPGDLAFSVHAVTLATNLAEELALVPHEVLVAIPAKPDRQFVSQITFTSSLEGMEIRDSHGRFFGVIAEGILQAEFTGVEIGHDIIIEASKKGYWPGTHRVRIESSTQTINLPELVPETKFRLGAAWHANYPLSLGARAEYYVNPDWQWLGAGASIFLQTYPGWSGKEDREILQFVLYPGLTAEIGSYVLTPPNYLVRTSLSSRLGLVTGFTMTSETRPSTDLYIQALIFGLELNIGSLVLRQESSFRWYLGLLPNRLFSSGYANTVPRIDVVASWKWEEQP